ncbi:hypothetical protein QFZ76_003552 [Streptomyces sp. V4I2]|nr:hypothetical protein [Streptomyces sp. V4I2]
MYKAWSDRVVTGPPSVGLHLKVLTSVAPA